MSGDLFHWKCWNKVWMEIYSLEKAKIRYGYGFVSMKQLNRGIAAGLLHWRGQNKVRLENSSI